MGAEAAASELPGGLTRLQQRGLTPKDATFTVIDEHSVKMTLDKPVSDACTLASGTKYNPCDDEEAKNYSNYLRRLLRAVLVQVQAAHEELGHGFGWTADGMCRAEDLC